MLNFTQEQQDDVNGLATWILTRAEEQKINFDKFFARRMLLNFKLGNYVTMCEADKIKGYKGNKIAGQLAVHILTFCQENTFTDHPAIDDVIFKKNGMVIVKLVEENETQSFH